MNKFFTLASAATIAIATAGVPALAQDATMTGVAGGAATGAIIGGPPGAVIGAIAGGAVGATADTTEAEMNKGQSQVHVVKQVPREVGTYAIEQPAPRVNVQEPIRIGEPLPNTVQVVEVPQYPQYAYANVNGQTVVVDAQTGKVLGVVKG